MAEIFNEAEATLGIEIAKRMLKEVYPDIKAWLCGLAEMSKSNKSIAPGLISLLIQGKITQLEAGNDLQGEQIPLHEQDLFDRTPSPFSPDLKALHFYQQIAEVLSDYDVDGWTAAEAFQILSSQAFEEIRANSTS